MHQIKPISITQKKNGPMARVY